MIYGNTEGIRDSELARLESLYDFEVEPDCFAPRELLEVMTEFTGMIGRELSVYIARSGEVLDVSVGNQNSVGLRNIRLRRNANRLSKVRCIHTHPNGDAHLSEVDISSLKSMYFDSMAAVGVQEGQITGVQASFLTLTESGELGAVLTKVVQAHAIPQRAWMERIEETDRSSLLPSRNASTQDERERAVLVSIEDEQSIEELAALAETAGALVVGKVIQKKSRPDTATFIGHGKADELSLFAQAKEADLVIFDDELSGVQQRNLEQILAGTRVLDRTALILDIFAQRARSLEGKLQVEMAQLVYQLPRLTGHGIALSRLGGGIGTRGPGETQLEMDRRRIRRRLTALQNEINRLGDQRRLRRGKRERNQMKTVALVGYTNAGKTTLLNRLSGESSFAENMLFATLDPLVRTVHYPDGNGSFLLIDTVGFISKLPHALVDAFRSTLEETVTADLLLVVSDGSSPQMHEQYKVVMEVLHSLEADEKPILHVLNKTDLESGPDETAFPEAVRVSALTGEGMDHLFAEIREKLCDTTRQVRITLPYTQAQGEAWVHRNCHILEEQYTDTGYDLLVEADDVLLGTLYHQFDRDCISVIENS